jgi:drug/metabolite transporter (DMT)-like permease
MSGTSPRLYAAYIALATVWGASFLFIEIGLEGLAPLQVAFARLVFGMVTLVAYAAVRRVRLPRSPVVWAKLAVLGLTFCAVPFALFAWAQTAITSGLASVYNATLPLWTLVLVSLVARAEVISRSRAIGIGIGFAGVCLVFAPALVSPGAAPVAAHLAALAAPFCYGIGFLWLRRSLLPMGLPIETIALGQVATGTVWAALFVVVGARDPIDPSWRVLGAMLALGALGTGLAYIWNTAIARGLGVTVASTATYLTPVVGVLLGVAVLGERLLWYEVVGGGVIVLGIAVGQGLVKLPAGRGATTGLSPRPEAATEPM